MHDIKSFSLDEDEIEADKNVAEQENDKPPTNLGGANVSSGAQKRAHDSSSSHSDKETLPFSQQLSLSGFSPLAP